MAYYVNVYLTDKAFGGAEEGGWWFDTGEAVRAIPCHTERRARRIAAWVDRILAAWNKRDDRREPSSVLCEGYYQAFIERKPAKNFPTARPHYE
jgi:hypothetical protein